MASINFEQVDTFGGKMATANSKELNVSWQNGTITIYNETDTEEEYSGDPLEDSFEILDILVEDDATPDLTILYMKKVVTETGNMEIDTWQRNEVLTPTRVVVANATTGIDLS